MNAGDGGQPGGFAAGEEHPGAIQPGPRGDGRTGPGGGGLPAAPAADQYQPRRRHDQARAEFRAVADRRAAIRNGTYKGEPGAPPDMHLSDWLEFQVLYREARRDLKMP